MMSIVQMEGIAKMVGELIFLANPSRIFSGHHFKAVRSLISLQFSCCIEIILFFFTIDLYWATCTGGNLWRPQLLLLYRAMPYLTKLEQPILSYFAIAYYVAFQTLFIPLFFSVTTLPWTFAWNWFQKLSNFKKGIFTYWQMRWSPKWTKEKICAKTVAKISSKSQQ